MSSILALAAVSSGLLSISNESTVLANRWEEAGWTVQRGSTSLHELILVSNGSNPEYVFRFRKVGSDFRRNPGFDPNLNSGLMMTETAAEKFTETLDWKEFHKLAQGWGISASELADEAAMVVNPRSSVDISGIKSQRPRRLSQQESSKLLKALRDQQLMMREISDKDGSRVENLPFDTKVSEAWIVGDVAWLQLNCKSDPLAVKYPAMVRITQFGLEVVFSHANDIHDLPFNPAFIELVSLQSSSKTLFPWWNYYESGRGQAGIWFRKQLLRDGEFSMWTPNERTSVLKKLEQKGTTFQGAVYANSSGRAILQTYLQGLLYYCEFLNGELLVTRSLDEAIKHVSKSNSPEVWWAYNGVSQQFGHPDMIQALYARKIVAGQ